MRSTKYRVQSYLSIIHIIKSSVLIYVNFRVILRQRNTFEFSILNTNEETKLVMAITKLSTAPNMREYKIEQPFSQTKLKHLYAGILLLSLKEFYLIVYLWHRCRTITSLRTVKIAN